MSNIHSPQPVKMFVGCIFSHEKFFVEACHILQKRYGTIDKVSDTWSFSHTNYYENEMGKNLSKKFVSFKTLVLPEDLKNIKIFTNKLEEKIKREKHICYRPINLDPGYLDMAKVLLATTKDYTHRIYLGLGIYAEVELYYQDKQYNFWPWTYPDYMRKEYTDYFLQLRKIYNTHLKLSQRNPSC